MSKKIIIITILAIMLVTQLSSIIYASTIDTRKTASLTIIEYENAYGTENDSSQNIPLSEVEITIYKIDSANYNKTASQLEEDLADGIINLPSQTLTTGTDGKIQFTDLELGRYLVVQTNSPSHVSVKMESFLIDLPRTSDDGTQLIYDVTVEPKNTTVYGDVLLNKTTKDLNALQGVYWELQFKDSSGSWKKYDYAETLVTDANGHLQISNLPIGDYRFVELGTCFGYILDKSNILNFEITAENPSVTIDVINERPLVNKQVKMSNEYGKSVGANLTDTVEWKTTADVPTIIEKMQTFYIKDNIAKELDLIENSLAVYAGDNLLTLNEDYTLTQSQTENGKTLRIDFVTSKLSGYDSVYFTYQTTFKSNIEYGKPITNSATLTYTHILDIEANSLSSLTSDRSTAEVHTGALTIQKVDANQNALQGAKFKISRTKEDAQNNIFIQDSSGNDIVLESDEDGYLTFYGLKYGNDNVQYNKASSSYYITEIESPTYEENGETKHYQLLSDSMEVTVNSYSGDKNDNCTKVINKKNFSLPLAGATGSFAIILIGAFFLLLAIVRINKNENEEI